MHYYYGNTINDVIYCYGKLINEVFKLSEKCSDS